ncbi:hypothetical protein HKD37_09G024520 [Glycine soja]
MRNFIMGHSMRLLSLNSFNTLKLLALAPTRFTSTIGMLKRFKHLKKGLQEIEDDINKAKFVKETLLDDIWWDKDDYILSFTTPIYDVLRKIDTDATCLHLKVIYRHERKGEGEESTFYKVVHEILINRWTKSSSHLHCLTHSLNPSEDSNRILPHQDGELTHERLKCFKRYFDDDNERKQVNVEFTNFGREDFDDIDSLRDRGLMETKSWWLVHGAYAPTLQKITLKNKMTHYRVEDLNIVRDEFGSLDENEILEVANLFLDEPELEIMFFNDDGQEEKEKT